MGAEKSGKLTPHGLDLLKTKWNEKLSTTKFFAYYRRSNGRGSVQQWWKQMAEGRPVPWKMLVKLWEYLNSQETKGLGLRCKLQDIAVETDEPIAPVRHREFYTEIWRPFVQWLLKPLSASPLAECASIEDVRLAVAMTMKWFGHYTDTTAPLDDSIKVAERVMMRSLDEWTKQIHGFWLVQPNCIRFVVHRNQRMGACIVLPLKDVIYELFRDGKLYDGDILPEHLDNKSNSLFVLGPCENVGQTEQTQDAERAMAMTFAHQVALVSDALRDLISPNDHDSRKNGILRYGPFQKICNISQRKSLQRNTGKRSLEEGSDCPTLLSVSFQPILRPK